MVAKDGKTIATVFTIYWATFACVFPSELKVNNLASLVAGSTNLVRSLLLRQQHSKAWYYNL